MWNLQISSQSLRTRSAAGFWSFCSEGLSTVNYVGRRVPFCIARRFLNICTCYELAKLVRGPSGGAASVITTSKPAGSGGEVQELAQTVQARLAGTDASPRAIPWGKEEKG